MDSIRLSVRGTKWRVSSGGRGSILILILSISINNTKMRHYEILPEYNLTTKKVLKYKYTYYLIFDSDAGVVAQGHPMKHYSIHTNTPAGLEDGVMRLPNLAQI